MKVAILTSGRFHVLDLARELTGLGHEVRFHSLVPPWRTRRFALPLRANRWLGAALGPLYLVHRGLSRARSPLSAHSARALVEAIDRAAAAILEPCDVFIGMSGMSLHSLRRARSLGATTIVERASMHIEAQREILDARDPSGPSRIPQWVVERERAEYAEADRVSLPSAHAEASFLARGFRPDRLLRNPFGVSLEAFPPTPPPPARCVLMVGTWSWQKGADTLLEAFSRLKASSPAFSDVTLRHVGSLGDLPLPSRPDFIHHEPVPQSELWRFYAMGSVLALASRQDGLAMVLCQGLASGLPLVCSTHSGGLDLKALVGCGGDGAAEAAVRLVPPDDPEALASALVAALTGPPRPVAVAEARDRLGWRAYGERWDAALRALPRGRGAG